ncbi:MAG: TaqI family restriction endonuclease [Nitrospirae bacterium]|nr:TaqI family restriction endonuclease [Nitrospirota bacterium]
MLLNKFEKFLRAVDLKAYREKYMPIKIVEMNLPKNIQAIELLYRVYWDKKEFIDFENFYKIYEKEKVRDLHKFQKKTGMCAKCFKKGIRARTYRTWAGLITQIHAGYVAEQVFGPNTIKMSEELDRQGADIQVNYKGIILNYDVKKIANTGVMGRGHTPKRPIPGEKIPIRYEVPNLDVILYPKKKREEGYKKAYTDFANKYIETKMLAVFPNGFVVFTPHIFEQKKNEVDQSSK